jgi:hypothetical protein
MGLRVSLLSVNEMGEFCRVTDKKDRGIIEHPIEVALVSLKLDSKPARITSSIGGTRLATNGGETDGGAGAFANGGEKRGRAYITQTMGEFKVAMGTCTLGMYLQ